MLLGTWVYSAFLGLFITLFVIVSLLLILIVLVQKGRGGGLASAFGGGGGNTAFGSKTGDVLTWATSIMFGVFVLLAIILNLMTRDTKPAVATGGTPAPLTTPAPAKGSTGGASSGTNTGTTPAPAVKPAPAPTTPSSTGGTPSPLLPPAHSTATTRPSSVPAK
jgi:preprotein translocase subunit SecG